MSVSIAYLVVILIWSTTPLGILWSSESVHPTMAVLLRMVIALVPAWLIILCSRIRMPWHMDAIKLYSYSAIGIFGGMSLSYFAAKYIPSGLMSLIFGFSPILSGILSKYILNDASFNLTRKVALCVAVVGLGIVCVDNLSLSEDAYIGIMLICLAVFFFSLSGVLVKSINISIHPLATTAGSLLLCLPLFIISWLIADGNVSTQEWTTKSIASIVYLGLVGSLVGFLAYFYVLQKLEASTVALVTMITPVIAISLGAWLNNEAISLNLVIGAIGILIGLAIYQWGHALEKLLLKWRRKEA
ncbi:DMT family transporter [Thalassotalea fusca]